MRKSIRRRRLVARRGAVIVEFALVVPFLALIVFGVIDFSRAYGQMNALDSALREGARFGSKWKNYAVGDYRTAVKDKIQSYATTYGFNGLDLTKVAVNTVDINNEFITVTVTAHSIPLADALPIPAGAAPYVDPVGDLSLGVRCRTGWVLH